MSELIPFGKYKGQPVEVLAQDKGYVEWLTAQPRKNNVSMDRAVREGYRALRMSVKSSDCTNRSIALSAKSASSTTARAREASKNTNPRVTK